MFFPSGLRQKTRLRLTGGTTRPAVSLAVLTA